MQRRTRFNYKKVTVFALLALVMGMSLFADRVRVRISQITRTSGGEGNYAGDVPNFISADGQRIAFSSDRDLVRTGNTSRQIFLWSQRGGFTQITSTESDDDSANMAPCMSADGRRIVFMSNQDLTPGDPGNPDGSHQIFLWTEGSGITQITASIGGGQTSGFANGWPVISRDGRTIAFHSDVDLTPGNPGNPDGNLELYLWREGIGLTQLTASTRGTANFAISLTRDGRRLAFYSVSPDGNGNIFIWTEGVGFTQITEASGCVSSRPAVTLDGRRIAFESDCDPLGNGNTSKQIFLWTEGIGITQITRSQGGDVFSNTAVSLSGDGRRIAFWSDRDLTPRRPGNPDGSHQLFVWIEGRGITQITNTRGGVFPNRLPSISANGRRIAFESDRDVLRNGNTSRQIFLATITID